MAQARPPRKVPGLCVVCRVDVHNPIKHYTSDSHMAAAHAWDRRTHGIVKTKDSA